MYSRERWGGFGGWGWVRLKNLTPEAKGWNIFALPPARIKWHTLTPEALFFEQGMAHRRGRRAAELKIWIHHWKKWTFDLFLKISQPCLRSLQSSLHVNMIPASREVDNWQCLVFYIFPLLQGNFITTSHYADVVEERMLSKKCGYPLCNNQLNQVK